MDTAQYRHELKYTLSYLEYIVLRQKIRGLMRSDPHADSMGRYRILSLYFDNYADKALREKVNGVQFREKFRLRRYNSDISRIVLEKKQKVNGLCIKIQSGISAESCRLLLSNGRWLPEDAPPLLSELAFKMCTQLLRPQTLVSYIREPYIYSAGNVRVTFDMDIRTGLRSTDFLNPMVETFSAGEKGQVILEVKYDQFLPSAVADMLQIGSLRVCAFSKYAACRQYE